MGEKLYYKMKEVCSLLDLAPHVIRFWEKELPNLSFRKNGSGHRVFSKADIDRLEAVKKMLYTEGLTIEGVRKRIRASEDKANPSKTNLLGEIKEIKDLVQDLIKSLDSPR